MSKLLRKFLPFSLMLLFHGVSHAVTSVSALTGEAIPERTPVITFGYVMQVLFSLTIVMGLIFLTAKYILPKIQIGVKGKIIEVVDRVGLEPQVSAFIVRVKKRSWLIVASSKNVQLISELEESEEI